MTRFAAFGWILLLALCLNTLGAHPLYATASATSLHAPWTQLLAKHVIQGGVDYQGFLDDEDQLDAYLETIRKTPPSDAWSRAAQEAYWLNVYNAATISLILQYYPVVSMNEIKIKTIGGMKSPWEASTVNVGGKLYSLNQIEREILKAKFQDPRVHFALVSAAATCPPLLNEAYSGERLDQQLDAQAQRFLSNSALNELTPTHVRLSSIFDWYAAEFGEGAALVAFLNRYATTKIEPTATVEFLPFNWSLNNQQSFGETQTLGQR